MHDAGHACVWWCCGAWLHVSGMCVACQYVRVRAVHTCHWPAARLQHTLIMSGQARSVHICFMRAQLIRGARSSPIQPATHITNKNTCDKVMACGCMAIIMSWPAADGHAHRHGAAMQPCTLHAALQGGSSCAQIDLKWASPWRVMDASSTVSAGAATARSLGQSKPEKTPNSRACLFDSST